MTSAGHRSGGRHAAGAARRPSSRRVALLLCAVLTPIGIVLVMAGSGVLTSGPPQPEPAAAGSEKSEGSSAVSMSVAPVTVPDGSEAVPPTPARRAAPATPNAATGWLGAAGIPTGIRGPLLAASRPLTLRVPAIGVDTPLQLLGRTADGTVEVPSLDDPESTAGWYRYSPTPGELGPAVILGHVDSRRYGPGVFYELGRMQPGDSIDIVRADGSTARFRVDGVRSFPKDEFPTMQVYGNLDHSGLRLITCGGQFDSGASSYRSNIVVFASLVSSVHA